MKTYFGRKTCPECRMSYDIAAPECPNCHHHNDEPELDALFGHHVRIGPIRQLVFFGIGLAGLLLLNLIATIIFEVVAISNNPGMTQAELIDYMSTPGINLGVSSTSYLALFAIFGLLLWADWKQVGKSFVGWKPYVAALVGLGVLYGFGILYNLLLQGIYEAAGRPLPGVNGNERALREMTVLNPALALIVFGVVGPFCEEMTYRVGLFGFLSRLGRIWAYVLTALIFGFIHFGWRTIGTNAFFDELANIPPYIFAGVAFGFLYDRYGFAASFMAHTANNLISLALTASGKQ